MKEKFKSVYRILTRAEDLERRYRKDIDELKVLQGRMLANWNNFNNNSPRSIQEKEFKVFSQWGDDGIIQWLVNVIKTPKTFIEFGVENYRESNTRFLLMNNNWEGMVIDGSEENIRFIRNDIISYAHHVYPVHAFITRENINALLSRAPFGRDLGILSIDIDGNDYWVWEKINVVNPCILILEYNAHFRLNHWTIPYKDDFVREVNNDRMNYWGASLASLAALSEKKGYDFIGCNSAGNNAYFVRKDLSGGLPKPSVEEGYEYAKYRETKDSLGMRVSDRDRLATIAGMPVFNTEKQEMETITV